MLTPRKIIGKSVRRTDALLKTTGEVAYAADWEMPRMLHLKLLRSPHPSARITKLNTQPALNIPGVVTIITAADLPHTEVQADIPGQTGTKAHKLGEAPVLADKIVRYKGEPIAIVAAERLDLAEKAVAAIEIEFEELPAVTHPFEALKPGAPIVAGTDNIIQTRRISKGDIEAGFAEADHIIENTYTSQHIDHAYLEPEAGVGWLDSNDVLVLRVSTQVIEHFRAIAKILGLPESKVRVMGTLVGGGFGGKEDLTVELFIALATLKTRRPCKLVFSREESVQFSTKRHPYTIKHKYGVKNDGTLVAAQVDLTSDAGAYSYLSPWVLLYSAGTAVGPYRIPNVEVNARSVATNNVVASAYRGFGSYQAALAYEAQMDEVAYTLNMDPTALREKNYLRPGDTTAFGQVIEGQVWLPQTTQQALAALGDPTPAQPGKKIGRGFAATMTSYGRITWFHDTSEAWVGVELDGSVVIRTGVPDIGAGQISSLCQIAAEVLGVDMDNISIHYTDSAVNPLAGTTTATRQLLMSGNATKIASEKVREVLLGLAAEELNLQVDDLDLMDGQVYTREGPEHLMSLADLAKKAAANGVPRSYLEMYRAPFREPFDPETGQGDIWPDFTFGTTAIEVEIDEETGETRVLKAVGAHDVGRAINMAAVEGQIEGSLAMGLGHGLMEDLAGVNGHPQALSLAEYLLPTAGDMPEFQTIVLESESGKGPFGAKGIGEPALNSVVPALANALRNAIGVRIFDPPFTPEKIVRCMRRANGH